MFEKILLILLGTLISSSAYLIKRWIEKKPASDVLERQQKILTIRKELKDQDITLEDLKLFENTLLKRNIETQKAINDSNFVRENNIEEFLCQAELNLRAEGDLKIAEARLEKVYNALSYKLDDKEGLALENSQKAWKKYIIKHAEFVSVSYEGGTIYPLIYIPTLESLVIERIASLQAELDEINRNNNLQNED